MRLLTSIFISFALLLGIGCHSSQPTTTAQKDWPHTVDAAVTRILATMKDADKQRVRATKKEGLIRFHHEWGAGIRNDFGLWAGNKKLMTDCQAAHPDEASMVIIQEVWQRLQTQ